MASRELTNEVAAFLRNISVSSDNGGSYDEYECKEKAETATSAILAALQEPTKEMTVEGYVRCYNPSRTWQAMLNASPLGEQSE